MFLGYARSGKLMFQMALESDTYYPIWGTCLGKILRVNIFFHGQYQAKSTVLGIILGIMVLNINTY